MGTLSTFNSYVEVSPNDSPQPILTNFQNNQFTLLFNCANVQ